MFNSFRNKLTKSESLDSKVGQSSYFKNYMELIAIKEENAELKMQNAKLMNMTSNSHLFDVHFDQNLSKSICF